MNEQVMRKGAFLFLVILFFCSLQVSATAVVDFNPVPLEPEDLSLSTVVPPGPNIISLIWEDRSDNETGFVIQRRDPGSIFFKEIASLKADVTEYTDTGLEPGTAYTYRIRAYNGFGESLWSGELAASTAPGISGDELRALYEFIRQLSKQL